MWRDPRHNRWQQRVNRQAKRAAERDYYLARLPKRDIGDRGMVLHSSMQPEIERLRLDAERLGIRLLP